MAEVQIRDNEMILATLQPDGPVDGVPLWSVFTGNGTLLSDPPIRCGMRLWATGCRCSW